MSFYNKGALEDDDIKLMFAFQKGNKKNRLNYRV